MQVGSRRYAWNFNRVQVHALVVQHLAPRQRFELIKMLFAKLAPLAKLLVSLAGLASQVSRLAVLHDRHVCTLFRQALRRCILRIPAYSCALLESQEVIMNDINSFAMFCKLL